MKNSTDNTDCQLDLPNFNLPNFYLLGHRGARAEFLENSEQGFAYAQQLRHGHRQLDGVEFDVQMTADGEFVVVHDETLTRLCGEQSWVMDKSLAELVKIAQSDHLRCSQPFDNKFTHQKMLPLSQLLPYLQGYGHIELEIKTHAKTHPQVLVKNLLRLLSDKDWQKLPITLTSFDTDILVQLQIQQALLPYRFNTGLLLEPHTTLSSQIAFSPLPNNHQLIYDSVNLACRLGCSQLGVYYAVITPTLVNLAKQFGLQVTAWTVNEIAVAKKLLAMGVDCVITDVPSEFLSKL